ncbi:MAG: patatin-like phospholipase family protein [Clostridia bacterium]
MKTALALGGGGAKGSYELGALIALKELGIEYDIVTGTSIGSLNGFFAASSDLDTLSEVWSNISMDQVLKTINIPDISLELANFNKFVKKNAKKAYPTDVIPLKNLIDFHVNEDKIRSSDIDFGLVCVHFPNMKPLELPLSEIPEGQLADYLLASCSIFPAFPMCKIDDKLHIDGGYYDNLPINLAVRMGADYVIAIDLFTKPAHPEYIGSPLVKYIKPSWDLSYILLFNKEDLEINRKLGYLDTMKAFKKLLGFRYAFLPDNISEITGCADNFARIILLFESNIPYNSLIVRKIISNPMSKCLKDYTNGILDVQDFFIRGIETCMEILDYDPCEVYNLHEVNRELLEIFLDRENYTYKEFFKNIGALSGKIDKQYLIGCILYKLLDTDNFTDDIYLLANLFPRETSAAFYLYSIM